MILLWSLLGVLALAALVYFLPTLIAIVKWKRNKLAVFALNALLGWTFIGWLVALIWALSKDQHFAVLDDEKQKADYEAEEIE